LLAAALWLGLAATIVWLQHTADVHSVTPGPQLLAAQARQVLRVGVRSYPRPTDSREALVSEPDEMDSALARALAAYLQVPVQLWALPDHDPQALLKDGSIDVLIAGSLELPTLEAQSRALDGPPGAYREGRLLALRNASLPQSGLQGVSVCVAEGSPWNTQLHRLGTTPQVYPSSIRAAVAFMAGDCRLLADERNTLERLQAQPDWRFYRMLDTRLQASDDARVYLASNDRQSLAYLRAALYSWQRDGGQERAWGLHGNAVLIDSLKVGQGLVCH
jgi:polar amino acid transport system substrate-binding protein